MFFNATDEEFAQSDLDAISIPSSVNGTNINLPSVGTNGTVFTWESSNTSVITANGTVTVPQKPVTVVLTAKTVVNGIEIKREFRVYVNASSFNGPVTGGGGGSGGGALPNPDTNDKAETDEKNENTQPPVVDGEKEIVYSDVKKSDWYYEAVTNLSKDGVLSGDGTGNFNPADRVTREQFLKMLISACKIETTEAENTFADVDEDAWYTPYVLKAKSTGIVNGISDTAFGIGTDITRQDMAVMISRVIEILNVETSEVDTTDFSDSNSVSDYARDSVKLMKNIGLIEGYNNQFRPTDTLTRGEAAKVAYELLNILK